MAGRALAFSDPEVVKLLRTRFIAVAGDDWYRRRQEDKVGEFFRRVADQGPRRGEGGSTRQGLYSFTAEGRLLAYRNLTQQKGVLDLLKEALAKWAALEEKARRPRRFDEERGADDPRYARRAPEGGLILRVHARELESAAEGGHAPAPSRRGLPSQSSLDHAWLWPEEWRGLVPERLAPGADHAVPAAISRRLARFHLVDNTRGEPSFWREEDVRRADLRLTVERMAGDLVVLRLSGKVHLETREGDRGYDAGVAGVLEYDKEKRRFRRFDVVALGDHWGEGRFTRGARPGRTPLGVAFLLADGSDEADKIPPQAAREIHAYHGS